MARRPELHYVFHNPNAPDVSARHLRSVCLQAAGRKLERERKKLADVKTQQEGRS